MITIHKVLTVFLGKGGRSLMTLVVALFLLQTNAVGQTFDFPSSLYLDSLSLKSIVSTFGNDTITVQQGEFGVMTSATNGPNFTVKSITALTNFKVNVESADVGQKQKFTYMILYKTFGILNPTSPTYTASATTDTLIVSYDRDSLKLINDRTFNIAGKYHKLKIVIYSVYEITNSSSGPTPTILNPIDAAGVPTFVKVYGEIYVQKFSTYPSLSMPSLSATDYINTKGLVRLNWSGSIKPAGYEVEWTYVSPGGTGPDFRNNATRVFTNNNTFDIPVAQKEGTLYYRARMVRPSINDLQSRSYGTWSGVSSVSIANSSHDGLNWDLKMNFVEDGKYKQVMTYYDGLLKPKQIQTRFNTKPQQTVVAQSLYDYQGRAVINSLPIPINGVEKFSYTSNFLHPAGASEYDKRSYDSIPNPNLCPPREFPIEPLDAGISSNLYFSRLNPNKTGKNAFIPDAENYPLVRKLFAAENSEKVLFEGQAGNALQYGNGRETEYLYGSPLQAELNKYFGQDVGKANYYRKMITTDGHDQDMFSITDNEGKLVASGLIGTPDTNSLALSIRNAPVNKQFRSNLLPSPQIRLDEYWRNNGSYFVEIPANYQFEYKIDYVPYKPCPSIASGLLPKVYYFYELIDPCGNTVLQRDGTLGGIGTTTLPSVSYSNFAPVTLPLKGNHTWNKYSYVKLEDLSASVDQYLETTGGCYKNFNQFLKEEFVKGDFPCQNNYDPCASMRLAMIKEMYPRAKYGKYNSPPNSTAFSSGTTNSIFSGSYNAGDNYRYLYQSDCIPASITYKGQPYNIRNKYPQELINDFNDSIGAALLPLHPDYCKLQMCGVINNPYAKIISSVNKASDYFDLTDAASGGILSLQTIINNDPLIAGILTPAELAKTMGDSFSIDSIAFKRTICGSELGVIESVCSEINATKTPADIAGYPEYIRDEYFKNLIKVYVENREQRLGEKLRQTGNCGPCGGLMLVNPGEDNSFALQDDNTFLITGMDSIASNTKLPMTSSFSGFVNGDPNINADSLNKLKNFDNSIYCTELVEHIINSLSSCNVTQAKLNELRDTLTKRFCTNNKSITSLSYDSLTNIMTSVGIATNDLCNAGLVDMRRIARGSGDFVTMGLLQYSPAYYQDLLNFLQSNLILNFIAGGTSTVSLSLSLCDAHPFEQNLAKQLGGILTPGNCSNFLSVQLTKSSMVSANSVKLLFTNGSDKVDYFLYPAVNGEYNALNTDFGQSAISATQDYKLTSLFNLYGFDKLSGSYANRNTTMLAFKGTQSSIQKNFAYFLSAFNTLSDYNLMEKDQKEYLNGVGCREFIPMAKEAITMAQQLNIKAGHPNFEKFFTNVVNYRNDINFDFKNYDVALRSCGLSDSIIIQKNIAHFRIKLPAATTLTNIQKYIDSLRNYDTVGIADVQAYRMSGYKYLLLNIYEADGKTLLEAKKQVQQRMPVGGMLEYLPYMQKDTVAQLLSTSFNPINIGSLTATFPTAVISNTLVDSIYYFIPGSGIFKATGNFITIVKNIPNNYDYNHYVDDIYKYVGNNAAMTSVFSHAESAVSEQYYDWQMTAWREYVNALPSDNHNEVAKRSKVDQFNLLGASAGPHSFATSRFSYQNSKSPFYINNLYIDHEPNSNSDYSYIKQMLQSLQAANFPQTIFKPYATSSPKVLSLYGYNTETRAYVCGDTTQFWINHFDKDNNMINIFVRLPDFLVLPRQSYRIVSINKGFEKDSVTYLDLVLAAQQGTRKDTIKCIAYTNKTLGETYTIPSAFLSSHSQFETLSGKFENCETRKLANLYPLARIRFNQYKDSARGTILAQFRQDVIDKLKESLIIIGSDIKHGLTLYYYDVAGNLVKTVSPAGVSELNVSGVLNDTINAKRARYEMTSPEIPAHSKVVSYRYNAQNKVTQTQTPDAGLATSQYDLMGRVVVSQNAKQQASGEYTYFLYDNLSRVIETGLVYATSWNPTFFTSPGSLINNHIKGMYRREVTVTNYDLPSYTPGGTFATLPAQDNLKNRVSSTKYFEAVASNVDASTNSAYTNALHYSYDVSGNVKTLIYDLQGTADAFMRFKRVDYDYDLYSGKVLLVSYNRGFADQFYQKYTYDADNRIVDAQTSNNGIKWDRDAHYDYYDHGPLARTELGEQRVQGIDYAYTINGWLKVTNGFQNGPQSDIGKDGITNAVMPKDVFSQRIDYFTGDYKAIDDSNYFKKLPAVNKSLYNGNIAAVATALAPFTNLHAKYHYDPQQRIDRADYTQFDYNYTSATLTTTNIPDYASQYKYDPDGNLLKLIRQGGAVPAALNPPTYTAMGQTSMDKLSYRYTAGTNKLRNVVDSSSTAGYNIDIPYYQDTVPNRYLYDASGNLTQDIGNGLSGIDWNRLGKLRSLQRADGSRMFFTYDPMGNRLTKEMIKYPATDKVVRDKTIYVRDASGNTLAVYEDHKELDLERVNWFNLSDLVQLIAVEDGSIPIVFARPLSDKLYAAYIEDGSATLAKLAMAVPQLAGYADDQAMLQDLVTSLNHSQALSFVKSIPDITTHTLVGANEGGQVVETQKLSSYLQPLMLSMSPELEQLQTELFTTLKTSDEGLFNATTQNVPISQQEKNEFPTNPALLQAYNAMPMGEKMQTTNMLAQALTTSYIPILTPISAVLRNAYSNTNTYTEFVHDIPGGDYIFDMLKQDANSYISYRYAQANVPIDTVKAQFNANGVLAGVIGQNMEPDAEALTAVLTNNFGQLVTLAGTSGQTATLVKGIKDVIAYNGGVDVLLRPWYTTKEVLKNQKLYLAEHHIYGSSRLGMQKYLPEEIKYYYGVNATGGVTVDNITGTKPWYTRYGNDLFSTTLYSNNLSVANVSSSGMGVNSHILGNRHYELTNQLGNVQATVLDRVTPIVEGQSPVQGYKADISNAWDYYPFGMYMPGRYVSDTARKCITINTTILVPTVTKVWVGPAIDPGPWVMPWQWGNPSTPVIWQLPKATSFANEKLYVFHFLPVEQHEGGWIVSASQQGDGSAFSINLGNEPPGVTAFLQLHADPDETEQQIGFELPMSGQIRTEMRVRQYLGNGEEYEEAVPWMPANGGMVSLTVPMNGTAIAAGGKTLLELRFSTFNGAHFDAGTTVQVWSPWKYVTTYKPESRVATICDGQENYRFGFNGQEKDNEMKGLGNSLDYGARIYDSRLARFLSVDPLTSKFAMLSPYQFAGNTPIKNIDLDGAEPVPDDVVRRAMTAGISYIKRKTAEFVVNATVSLTKNYVENKLEEKVNSSDPQQTSVALTVEFMTGLGPKERNFDGNHPFTQSLKNSNATTIALGKFYEGYKDYMKGERKSLPTQFRLDFPNPPKSGGDTGPVREYLADGKFTAAQFTGTMLYEFHFDEKTKILDVTVSDTKNMRSALFHLPGTDKHSREQNPIMGETTQTYNFSVPLTEVKQRAETK